jgi:hypothetical protein
MTGNLPCTPYHIRAPRGVTNSLANSEICINITLFAPIPQGAFCSPSEITHARQTLLKSTRFQHAKGQTITSLQETSTEIVGGPDKPARR